MMKRTALSIVRDALARRGGFGMDASDEKKKKQPWTVEQTSDDEVTYKFKVHIDKKKFKPVSKELAQQTGVAGNGDGDGEKGEDEDGNGGRGGTAQDSAFYVVMDSPTAAVNAARRQCAATIEQCRARNKFACPYHGAQAVKADLIDRLTAAGINTVPTVEADLDMRGKPTGTYSISIPCVNTPDQRRAMEGVINNFLRSPGIDQQSTGEGAENDYDDEEEMYNSFFDVDGLNTEARNEGDAHEEREEEPPAQEQPQEQQPRQEERNGLSESDFNSAALAIANAGDDIFSDAFAGLSAILNGEVQGFGAMSSEDMTRDMAGRYMDILSRDGDRHRPMIDALQAAVDRLPPREEPEQAPETPADAERETPPAEEPQQEEQTEQPQAEEGWGTFEDANGNPIRIRTDIQEYIPREILIDYMNGRNSNETRDLLGVNLNFDNASVRDMRELISAANHLDQLGADYANASNATDRENIQREIDSSRDSFLRAIAKYATPLPQAQPQSAEPTETAEDPRVTPEELERAFAEQDRQQQAAREEVDRVFNEPQNEAGAGTGGGGGRATAATPAQPTQAQPTTQGTQQTETPAPQPQGEQPQAESTQNPRQQPMTPIPSTPFSDMATEAFTRAKNAAFSAGPDDRVAQARGRALSSVLGRANGIAGGHTMDEIHDRLHNMMGEAVMRNDRESVQGYQQALDMIGNEGGFTPHPFDPRSVRAPEIDYGAIEHGEGDDITESEIEAVKNLAKAANIDAYNAGSNDSSRSPEAAYAHALANFLSRDGGLQRREGITKNLLVDKMRARLRAKQGDEVATEGTLGAIAAIGNVLSRDMTGFEFLQRVQNGMGRGQQTRTPTPQATQRQTATTEAQPQQQTTQPRQRRVDPSRSEQTATAEQQQAASAEPPRQPETPAPQPTPQPPPAASAEPAAPSPQPAAQPTPQPPPPTPRSAHPQQPQASAPQPQTPATPRTGNNGFTGRRAQAAAQRLDESARRAGTGRVRSILERIRDNARRLGGQDQN